MVMAWSEHNKSLNIKTSLGLFGKHCGVNGAEALGEAEDENLVRS